MAMAVICASNTYADNAEMPSDSTKNQSIQASISNQNAQTHSLSQTIDQTLQYQLQTGLWQTPQQIGQANLAQIHGEVAIELTTQQLQQQGVTIARTSVGVVNETTAVPAMLVANTDQQALVSSMFSGRV